MHPLVRGLLGITPSGVGETGVTVVPPTAAPGAARGTEWTERGPVSVVWTRHGAGLARGGSGTERFTPVRQRRLRSPAGQPASAS